LREKGIQDRLYSHLKNSAGSLIIIESNYKRVFACIIFSKVESTIGKHFIVNGKQYNDRKGIGK